MTKLSFDDGEAFDYLEKQICNRLRKRFSTVWANYDLKYESRNTKREDTQTFIIFNCRDCKKQWKSGFGLIEVYFKFKRGENSVSFSTWQPNQQCRDCGEDALSCAKEVDLKDAAARLCANIETSLGLSVKYEPAEFVLKKNHRSTKHLVDYCDACKDGVCYYD